MNPYISIVIPTFNRRDFLKKTLDSIYQSDYDNFEVIVVDDCSTDGTQELLKKYNCKTIVQKKHQGPASARNKGALEAKGEIIQFLDSDVIISKTLLSLVAGQFQNDGSLDCLVGTYSEKTASENFISQFKNLFIRFSYITLPGQFNSIHSCVTAIRKTVFEFSGGFNEKYKKAGIEDIKYGQELADNGYRIKFNPAYEVVHAKYFTLPDLIKNDFNKGHDFVKYYFKDKQFKEMVDNKKLPNSNRNFIFSIPSAFLMILFLLIFYTRGNTLGLVGFFMFAMIFISSNYEFLQYLSQVKGKLFAVKSISLLIINAYTFGLSIFAGALSALLNKK